MFDFWKEVIINDASRVKSLAGVYAGTPLEDKRNGLRVERCADYLTDYVVGDQTGPIIYKTLPVKGVCAEITLANLGVTASSRVEIALGLSVGQDSEFAKPWFEFGKNIIVEAEDAASLEDALRLAVPSHIAHIANGKLVINDPKVSVEKVMVTALGANGEATGEGSDKTADAVTTKNRVPVGTGAWILENLRFPTHVNTRVAAPNADDMPVANGKYVQYAFEYAVPKRGFHGQGAVGQAVTSVTHHVFFVLDSIVSEVEAAFLELAGKGRIVLVNEDVETEAAQEYYSTVLDEDATVATNDDAPSLNNAEKVETGGTE